MDKNAIKKYAVWARNELISRVSQRAQRYGITKDQIVDANADSVNGIILTDTEKKQRQALIQKIREKGFEQVMEEVAYTWFNRFSALRFMEVNGYLPSHVRVFTDQNNAFKPEIMSEAIHLDFDGLDMEKVYALKEANNDDELFKYLIITQCNDLSRILPGMFQKIADYTELLFPDNLLREGSAVQKMVTDIPENDWNVSDGGQIEILGWLYQYYISEKHEAVVDPLHGKVVAKDEVPAATALFTTDWVVRYIIDNSVGRYWIERNPESKLADELEYFVKPKDGKIPVVNEKITPEELTVFDPSMGSAHFGVYAFEVLEKIYTEYGYSERDAAAKIVENNLFGLDIDDRSAQIAYFAIMMKARQYDRRFFSKGIQPHFYSIQESNDIDEHVIDYFSKDDINLKKDINSIVDDFRDAKEYGSIQKINQVNFESLYTRFEEISSGADINMYSQATIDQLLPLVKVAEVMSKKYSVVATNPPYMNKYDSKLKIFINDNYKNYSGDLFSVFISRNFGYCKSNGYVGYMTPFVWMFIKTYEKLRHQIINNKAITTLIQFEYSAFSEATVPICSFVLKNGKSIQNGVYFRLSEFKGGMDVQKDKVLEALFSDNTSYIYSVDQNNFTKIPGEPIAYWVPDYGIFDFPRLGEGYVSGGRNKTHNNILYLRNWWEVSDFDRWQPYANGGDYRKWYGNHYDVVDWSKEAKNNYASHGGLYNSKFWGKQGVCWNLITSSTNGFRIKPSEFHYSSGSPTIISNDKEKDYLTLGFLNTKVAMGLIKMFNPTINTTVNDVLDLPFKCNNPERVIELVKICINLSKEEWDSYETSFDFVRHPLVPRERHECLISDSYNKWEKISSQRFIKVKEAEEELNQIFIETYDLKDTLTSDLEDADITIRKANQAQDIRSLISYAVGCMFGRYSLDYDGIIYPGSNWDISKYITYKADKDAILPVSDDEYFDDDIVNRFIKFIKVVYGEYTLEDNLNYIAESLGGRGSSREVIREYFINTFYLDHLKTYQKRPIYWLFDSGRKNGFKCLVYIHRYQPDTMARIRTDYVHEQQARYRTAIAGCERQIEDASSGERVKLNNQLKKLNDQVEEIRSFEEKIHHLADQMISIDINVGVRDNYKIFKDVLAKIK